MKITQADVEQAIAREFYFTGADIQHVRRANHEPELTQVELLNLVRTTFCVLVLKNGMTVTGTSVCQDAADYHRETGETWARQAAVQDVYPLLIYASR